MVNLNSQSELALKFVRDTGMNLFLTGKAGTGKTTFLKQLKELSPKRMIIVAPTGVAAINARGVTIHSFFQLPFGPHIPSEGGATVKRNGSFNHKFSKEKKNIIRSLDLLVIDEISMVRADLLDAISEVLRRYKNKDKPFGGVQLLLIGDLQQLAPVSKEDEWNLLKEFYPSPFFFDSKELRQSQYITVELTHVYRQTDGGFLRLLNNIRDNSFDMETLSLLNQRYIPGFSPDDADGYITLTTHNQQALQINQQKLSSLPEKPYVFTAELKGEYPVYSYPTDEQLVLKKGAQVMFIKNDSSPEKRFYNGKIGKVTGISPNHIVVTDEAGGMIEVNREVWQNTKYIIDDETKEIKESVTGAFTQYPLKTAWAITIHKSQGLTFDRAIIDAAAAFSHGQVYVALSRCRTLEGLVLSSPIQANAMIMDDRVSRFTGALKDYQADDDCLQKAQHQYFLHLVSELFDFTVIQLHLNYLASHVFNHLCKLYPAFVHQYSLVRERFQADVSDIGTRFQQQLSGMINADANPSESEAIQDRIRKGVAYFAEKTGDILRSLPDIDSVDIKSKEANKQINYALDQFMDELGVKIAALVSCRDGFAVSAYLSAKAKAYLEPNKKESKKKSKSRSRKKADDVVVIDVNTSDIQNPELYQALKSWRNEMATKRKVPVYIVIQQKALIGISNMMPGTKREMLSIPGVGKKLIDSYGDALLDIIKLHR